MRCSCQWPHQIRRLAGVTGEGRVSRSSASFGNGLSRLGLVFGGLLDLLHTRPFAVSTRLLSTSSNLDVFDVCFKTQHHPTPLSLAPLHSPSQPREIEFSSSHFRRVIMQECIDHIKNCRDEARCKDSITVRCNTASAGWLAAYGMRSAIWPVNGALHPRTHASLGLWLQENCSRVPKDPLSRIHLGRPMLRGLGVEPRTTLRYA